MRDILPYKPVIAVLFAVSLLVVAVPWAAFVANTPKLAAAPGVPYFTNNVVMSVPVAIIWVVIAAVLTKYYLMGVSDPAVEGLKLGLMFAAAGLFLDGLSSLCWSAAVGRISTRGSFG
jgi:uncharacterized membrane protein (DUF485 family)